MMKLLIVDDEIFAIQGILDGVDWSRLDFEKVLTANSYAQAVNIFMENDIDVLLCDIEMPYGSGLDLAQWVEERSPQTQCIFLTCHDEFSFAQQAIRLHCLDYLLKPVPPDRLTSVLEKAADFIRQRHDDENYKKYGKLYVERMTGVSDARKQEPSRGGLECVEKYIHEHLSEQLSVEELAKIAYISPDYLTKLFKKKYNKTVIDYITDQRMFLAKELLEQDLWSVSMISAKVGYSNYSYFTRLFKKYYGKTPREYRQACQQKAPKGL